MLGPGVAGAAEELPLGWNEPLSKFHERAATKKRLTQPLVCLSSLRCLLGLQYEQA
jgi:hypothetical protein